MKILFLLDLIYSGESANIKIVKRIAANLCKNHDVQILCNSSENQKAILNGFNTTFFECYKDKTTYDVISKCRTEKQGSFLQALTMIKKPVALLNAISTVFFKKSLIEKELKSQIEKACQKDKFDVVISVSCPHYSMFALAKSNITAKKVCYMADPYWSNKTIAYAVSFKREMQLYKKIDAAIITDLMLEENLNTPLKQYSAKMKVLAFPGIEEKMLSQTKIRLFDDSKINCAFIGNLYPTIRSPKYLLDIASLLDEKIVFLFTGGGREGFDKNFFEYYEQKLQHRLSLNDTVDSKTANNITLNADVLVNIGNTIANQLPSKVLDYISTGKPILNIYKIDNCPSLAYLKKYPLALNVKEDDFTEATITKINEFCKNSKGKKIEFKDILVNFNDNTPQVVANNFEKIIFETVGK